MAGSNLIDNDPEDVDDRSGVVVGTGGGWGVLVMVMSWNITDWWLDTLVENNHCLKLLWCKFT